MVRGLVGLVDGLVDLVKTLSPEKKGRRLMNEMLCDSG